MARKRRDHPSTLTELELKVMNCLWKNSPGTAREIQKCLNAEADDAYAYTTVSTMLRILTEKGFVNCDKELKQHSYYPVQQREAYGSVALKGVVEGVFQGQISQAVRHLVGSRKLTRKDLAEIQEVLNSFEAEKKG